MAPVVMQIDICNLSKVYPGQRGLFPVSLEVNRGEQVAVIGHNGAGKSTLLKLLGNWLLADTGHVTVEGVNLRHRRAAVRKIGFVPETPNLYDLFTVEYNLLLFARLFRVPVLRIEEILGKFNLIPYRKTRVQDLSKGLKQRVSLGRALLADPPVLLLDEPTSGLDIEMTQEIYRQLKEYHASGKTILLSSHRPEEVENLATRVLAFHQGRLVFDGPPRTYLASETYHKSRLRL